MTIHEQRHQWIVAIGQLPTQLEHLLAGMTPSELAGHFLPGEWSTAQNVHHLADSHLNSYIRCRLIATEDNPTLKPYDQDAWAALPDAQLAAVEPSLQLLAGLHLRWVHFWENLHPEEWMRVGFHPESGIVTLEDQARTYAGHGLAHIAQIRRTIAAQYLAAPDSMTALRARIDREWERLHSLVQWLSPAQLETPGDDGWSPKVHLGHLAAWENRLAQSLLGNEPEHVAMGLDAAAYAAADLDGINALLFARDRLRPSTEILAELQVVHERLLNVLAATTWAELQRERLPGEPLLNWVSGNTYEHYLEHWLLLPVA